MINILFHTTDAVLGKGVSEVLRTASGLRFLGVIENVFELSKLNLPEKPDVLLVDWEDGDNVASVAYAHELLPQAKIVLLARSVGLDTGQELLQMGVRGILQRRASIDLFIKCLVTVAAGEMWLEASMVDSLLSARRVRLSPRERQLLQLVSRGWSNKQMAYQLEISEGTVKIYLSKLFRKVGVADRFELALYGLRRGQGSSNSVTVAVPDAGVRETVYG